MTDAITDALMYLDSGSAPASAARHLRALIAALSTERTKLAADLARVEHALGEAIYEITSLSPCDELWNDGPHGYKPLIKASHISEWRNILNRKDPRPTKGERA